MQKAIGTHLRAELASRLTIEAKSIVYAPVNVAMRLRAETTPTAVLNMVSMYRTGMEIDRSRLNNFVARNGIYVKYTDETKQVAMKMRYVPKILTYTIENWFTNADCLDSRALLFDEWLVSNDFTLKFTDVDTQIEYEFPIILEEQADNSDLESQFEKGKIFRLTTVLNVQALIPVVPPTTVKTILTVECDIYSGIENPILEETHIVSG